MEERVTLSRLSYAERIADQVVILRTLPSDRALTSQLVEIHGELAIVVSSLFDLRQNLGSVQLSIGGRAIFGWQMASNLEHGPPAPGVEEFVARVARKGSDLQESFRMSSDAGVLFEGNYRPNVESFPLGRLGASAGDAFNRNLADGELSALRAFFEMEGGDFPGGVLTAEALSVLHSLLRIKHWPEADWEVQSEWTELDGAEVRSFLSQFPALYWESNTERQAELAALHDLLSFEDLSNALQRSQLEP